METLEELREKYNNLNKERFAIYEKIKELEQQKVANNFAVGECYFSTYNESFKKIIAIDENAIYCIVVNEKSIQRNFYYLDDTKYWEKITSEQFKDIYLAVMKDIQDPDLEDKIESNWDITLEPIMNSIDNR